MGARQSALRHLDWRRRRRDRRHRSHLARRQPDRPDAARTAERECRGLRVHLSQQSVPLVARAKSGTEIHHVAARDARVSIDDLAREVDDRTIALSVTHVSPLTGFRHDLAPLAELARAHGAYLVVDAAQSAGALDLDVRREGVDFLTTCAMKWLLGAPGVGFLLLALLSGWRNQSQNQQGFGPGNT
ncbi:MAG: aminotransferase class V-fold PLP-dependent enzyme [Chloroflexi bacterium]|nr:aminotransferase class V-fold PLP-dependent enzyme [Chloroflexota bacterium]